MGNCDKTPEEYRDTAATEPGTTYDHDPYDPELVAANLDDVARRVAAANKLGQTARVGSEMFTMRLAASKAVGQQVVRVN